MSDQFRNIANRIVNFVAGERPSADKFNKLVSYFRNNIQVLNNVVGDLEGSQDPFSGSDLSLKWGRKKDAENEVVDARSRYLDIATLGRLIGPSANLNARELTDRTYYIEEEAVLADTTVYHPNYPILTSSTISITGLTATTLDQPGATEFKVSTDGLEITFGSLVASNTFLSYTTSPAKYSGGSNYQGARFNVIPDPNQSNGVEVRANGNGYLVNLPEITNLQSSLITADTSSLSIEETTNISDGVRSKYSLPKVLVDKYEASPDPAPDAVLSRPIPKYFLYLKCETTKESFKEASYYYVDQHTVYIENIDLGDCNLDEHVFRIVTIGTDITSSIDDLRVKFKKHVHDGSYGESRVSIENLSEIYNNQGSTAPYFKSLHSKNPISYYLHRDGYKEGDDLNANNMMRGHLVIGSQENSASSNLRNGSVNSTSYALLFGYSSLLEEGSILGSPRLYRDLNNTFKIESSGSGGIEIKSAREVLIDSNKAIENDVSAINIEGYDSNIRIIGVEPTLGMPLDGTDYYAVQAKAKRVALEGETTSVIGEFFEAGNVDYHGSNAENGTIMRRPEEELTSSSSNSFKKNVKNIVSGGRINKDISDESKLDAADIAESDVINPHYRKSYLNINATLFRRERELYQIGYSNADIPALYFDANKIVGSNGNTIAGGYVIKSSYADILLGGYSGLTNDGARLDDDNYLNIIIDLGYDDRGYPIYKNHKAGKEFKINITYTKTIDSANPLEGIRFINVGPFARFWQTNTKRYFEYDGSSSVGKTIDDSKNNPDRYTDTNKDGNGLLEHGDSYLTYYDEQAGVNGRYIVDSTFGLKNYLAAEVVHKRTDNSNGFHAGVTISLQGYETHYPVIINGQGGLGNPSNSQDGINTGFICSAKLFGNASSNDLDGTIMEPGFGTN